MTRSIVLFILRFFRRLYWYFLQIKGLVVFGRRVGIIGNFYVGDPSKVTIGAECGINYGVFILGHTKITIGNNVIISARAMLIDAGLNTINFADNDYPAHIAKEIVIEDNVWIGAGAIILPGVTVGAGSVVGAGAVVTRNVVPKTIVAGAPARPIGRTCE